MSRKRTKSICRLLFVSVAVLFVCSEVFGSQGKIPEKKLSPDRPLQTSWVGVQSTGPSDFTPEMPFSEAIEILRNSTKPPLNIAVLWKDLRENADIYPDTPIEMEGLSGIPLRKHLDILLMSVSGAGPAKLKYEVSEGVIVIATEDSLPARRITRVYDITDLVAPPANYFFIPMPGMMPFSFGTMPYGTSFGSPYRKAPGSRPNGPIGIIATR